MKSHLRLVGELLTALPSNARRFIVGYSVSLAALAVLDAMSLALLAVVISPLATGGSVVLPVLGAVEGIGLIWLLGVVCMLVLTKGFLSVVLLWFATRRFASFELAMGIRLF